ncbi:hypothetical protein CHS0354_032354 [Potamilus streckersoni]|uniref:Chitin-binding type-2 domain-containing protein n=1 Tax=Potamilus streckersoni TaxID=2493646 RepID=A0AAE0WDW9_9BIVA|nr:hypothetical protein CHS0354_032354 [Potamilus streckersoni]
MDSVIVKQLLFIVLLDLAVADNLCKNSLFLEWKRDPTDCSVFYMCVGDTAVKYTCPDGEVADVKGKACVPEGSIPDICTDFSSERKESDQMFKSTSTCKIGDSVSHSGNCAKFLECTKAENGSLVMQERECPYPLLYDDTSAKCDNYQRVTCENRHEPKDPCEYDANQCKSIMCVPCHVRYPSCSELPDGKNPWMGKEWSPFYVVCHQGRVTLQEQCPHSDSGYQIFNPYSRECVEFYLNNRAN